MKLWHKGLNRCTIYFGMGFQKAMWRGLWNQLLKWELLREHLKPNSSQKKNLLERKIFPNEHFSRKKNLLESKIFLKEKSSWKKNLERNRIKFCWKKLEGYKNIYIISNNWQGMTNVTKSTPPSQKIIVYLWRPPPSYLLFPKNFNR